MAKIERIDKDFEDAIIEHIRRKLHIPDNIPIQITSLDIKVRKSLDPKESVEIIFP